MVIKNKKILLATGGSGGHIFPAISVADILSKDGYDVYITGDVVLEKYISNVVHKIKIINTSKNYKSIKGVKDIIFAIFESIKFIKNIKPDLVIGFGSYATFPILSSCLLTKIPFLIHEQNTHMGSVNKIFSKYSKKTMISYYEIYGFNFSNVGEIVFTGNPIRKDIKHLYKSQYKINDSVFNILITGGSLGAKVFSEILPKIFDKKHKKEQEKLKIYHQVQPDYIDDVKKYYKEINLDAEISPFFNNIYELLDKANLVIGRSGNGTLTETSIAGKPAILIPLPTSKNDHQKINARIFEKSGAALVITEDDLVNNIQKFQKVFFDLIKNEKKLIEMSENMRKNAIVNGDENVLKVVNEFFQ